MSAGGEQVLRLAVDLLASLAVLAAAAWGAFALSFKAGGGPARRLFALTLWAAVTLAALALLWSGHLAPGIALFASAHVLLLAWWRRLTPSNHRPWAEDVARLATGTADGDRVTINDVRDFDWRSPTDYTARWETRQYHLDRLRGVDMIMSYWRGPSIAHAQFAFCFDDGEPVVFSVEVRRQRDQTFSEIGGFFKQFELCILAARERDSVRLRTNVRGEEVYLYRLALGAEARRSLFLAYVDEANRLASQPRFYHTVTVNCTTLVYQMMRRIVGRLPLDYRLLFSGYLPEYVYRVGGFGRRWPLAELRARGRITERARAADRSPTFSADIRRGVPGIRGGGRRPAGPLDIAPGCPLR